MLRFGDSDSGSAGHAHTVSRTCRRLGEMRSAAVEPNGHSYLAVFDVYKAARDVEGAKRAWQDMRTAGVQPVYPAVSTIMSTVAKTGDISAAEAGAKKPFGPKESRVELRSINQLALVSMVWWRCLLVLCVFAQGSNIWCKADLMECPCMMRRHSFKKLEILV